MGAIFALSGSIFALSRPDTKAKCASTPKPQTRMNKELGAANLM
jgi:hypothetical protein